jgi:BRO family, N-terminal domain
MSERDHGEGENVVRLPTEFRFEESSVRAVMYNDEPWFIAKDVCDILDIDDPSKAVSRIDDDERGTTTVRTAGGPQEVLTLNESGVYSLVFTSRKPEAKRFRKWVTSEVLPEIRNTGGYRRPETEFAGLSGERVEYEAGFWSGRSSTLSSSPSGCRASASITSGWLQTIRTSAQRAPTPIWPTTIVSSARTSIDRSNSYVAPSQAPSSTAVRNQSNPEANKVAPPPPPRSLSARRI